LIASAPLSVSPPAACPLLWARRCAGAGHDENPRHQAEKQRQRGSSEGRQPGGEGQKRRRTRRMQAMRAGCTRGRWNLRSGLRLPPPQPRLATRHSPTRPLFSSLPGSGRRSKRHSAEDTTERHQKDDSPLSQIRHPTSLAAACTHAPFCCCCGQRTGTEQGAAAARSATPGTRDEAVQHRTRGEDSCSETHWMLPISPRGWWQSVSRGMDPSPRARRPPPCPPLARGHWVDPQRQGEESLAGGGIRS
jgi:hypothetical protein